MRFEFATANRILFGAGTRSEVGALARELGRRALVIVGRDASRAQPILATLKTAGLDAASFSVNGEPTVDCVRQGVRFAQENQCDLLVGLGGGSVLDAAKAISALMTNGGDPLDYVEVIGKGRPLLKPATPLIALPTTAGTGTEVTRNAVLGSPEHRVKVSIRSSFLLARVAIVDPELTHSTPPTVTAYTGLDALTQLIEPYVSVRANPLTDALCREGMARIARSLARAWENGADVAAREDMAVASLFSGLALANAALGAVHGIAGPLGGMFPAPHGAICASLLPHVMAANIAALEVRQPAHPALWRYEEIARILTGRSTTTAQDGVRWVHQLCRRLQVEPLGKFGVNSAGLLVLIPKAQAASSMRGNPIALTEAELEQILLAAL